MSSLHGPKSRKPAHQNSFAFRHNPGSKKTAAILSMPISGVCQRCREKLEWRKMYRKYKPLRQPGKCAGCSGRNVMHAYHNLCTECGKARNCCAMCYSSFAERAKAVDDKEVAAKDEAKEREFQEMLASLKERQRRTVLRKMERGEPVDLEQLAKAAGDDDFDFGDDDDFDMDGDGDGDGDEDEDEDEEA